MSLIAELFGKSPFGPLVEHSKKVHECVELVKPLLEALIPNLEGLLSQGSDFPDTLLVTTPS